MNKIETVNEALFDAVRAGQIDDVARMLDKFGKTPRDVAICWKHHDVVATMDRCIAERALKQLEAVVPNIAPEHETPKPKPRLGMRL